MTRACAPAPATTSVRGCDIIFAASAPDTKITWIGCSSTTPSGTWTKAPSWTNAVFSAVKLRVGVGEPEQPLRGARNRLRRGELDRAERRGVREPPLLVADGRDAERGELRGAARAQIVQPARATLGTLLQRRRKCRSLFCYLSHLLFELPVNSANPQRSIPNEPPTPNPQLGRFAELGVVKLWSCRG